jgi:hypothetical protein
MSSDREAAPAPVDAGLERRQEGDDQRERLADDRERWADDRERLADDREREADDRQALADDRERHADDREREADDRQALADERDHVADDREAQLDQHGRELRIPVVSVSQRAMETIRRSRDALSASGQRLDRSEATLRRAAALVAREQADIDRASAQGTRDLQHQLPDPGEHIERATLLRKRIADTASALAWEHEEIARIHDEMAARRPSEAAEYLRIARKARTAADRARKTERDYGNPSA